jgi:hypothetical protein
MTAVLDTPVAARPIRITEPGVYDIPAEVYHQQSALSASGMKKLLPPSCPAIFRYEQDHPQPPKKEFDFGHAAHRLVLGAGEDLAVIDAPDWKTKSARDQKDAARAEGFVPLLPQDMDKARTMADEVRRHPLASALFQGGRPEQSLFWNDAVTGIARRARLDWLSDPRESRLIVADYKTTTSVDLDDIERSVYEYGYNVQNVQYTDAVRALGLGGEDTVMVFVFQMKTPPFLIRVVQLEQMALKIGRAKIRAAIDKYRECLSAGVWPGYDDIAYAALPVWGEKKDSEEYL